MSKPVWGMLFPRPCYHQFRDCATSTNFNQNISGILMKYESEARAVKIGHFRPCGLCVKRATAVESEGLNVSITKVQLEVLRIIKRAHDRVGGPPMLKECATSGLEKTRIHRVMDRLVRGGFLTKKYTKYGKRAIGGVTLTDLAYKALARQDL